MIDLAKIHDFVSVVFIGAAWLFLNTFAALFGWATVAMIETALRH